MANVSISALPPAVLPLTGNQTFFEVQTVEAGEDVSRKVSLDDIVSTTGLDASFVTVSSNPQLPNERVLTAGTGISLVDSGPNGTITINGGTTFPLLAPDGTAGAPSYSFSADTDIGMYRIGIDTLGLAAGGIEVARLFETGGDPQFILPLVNAPTTPTLAFGDGDSGFFQPIDDNIQVSLVGVARFFWELDAFNAANGTGPAMFNEASSSTNPVLIPRRNDPDTGIGSSGGDGLSLIAGGVEIARALSTTEEQFAVARSGNSAVPDLTSLSDLDTGFWWNSFNETAWMGGGSRSWWFSTAKFYSNFSNGPALMNEIASSTNPTVVPDHADPNTGLGLFGDDALSIIAGGLEAIRVAEVAGNFTITYFGVVTYPTGSAGAAAVGFDGDTDTGLFSPGDDQVALTAGGVEGLRVTEVTGNITVDVFGDFIVTHTAVEDGDTAVQINHDAAGFSDAHAIGIDHTTGALATGEEEAVIFVNIDANLATGGTLSGLEVLAVEPGNADSITGLFVGGGVAPVRQLSGSFANADTILDNAADVTVALSTGGAGNIGIFDLDNDTVTVGSTSTFQQIEFILGTVASGAGIQPLFEFSTGIGTWATFSPTDGTNQMRQNGVIAWLLADIPSWATGTGGEFLIRITRQRNSLATTPIADLVQILIANQYRWDENGDITLKTLRSVTAASGGLEVDNQSTGVGFERVLTTSDLGGGSTIIAGTVDGQVARWDNIATQWEPAFGVFMEATASPPTADEGYIRLVSTATVDVRRPQIFAESQNTQSVFAFWETQFDDGFYQRIVGNGADRIEWGREVTSVDTDMFSIREDSTIRVEAGGDFMLQERAAARASIAGLGQIWVRNDTPNVLVFTDDAGTDFVLSGGASVGAGTTVNSALKWSGASWVEETDFRMPGGASGVQVFNGADFMRIAHDGTNGLVRTGGSAEVIFGGGGEGPSTYWRFEQAVRVPDGSAAAPGLVFFTGGTDGFYRNAFPGVSASVGGVEQLRITNADTEVYSDDFILAPNIGTDRVAISVNPPTDLNDLRFLLTSLVDIHWRGTGGERFVLEEYNLAMVEKAAAPADVAGVGQFWVRNDTPNTPMFTDDAGTDYVLNAGGVSFPELRFTSGDFDNPNSANWAVNALAPAVADSVNNGLTIRAFDDTTEEGVGFQFRVPSTAANITIEFFSRAQTAPGAARTVGLSLYRRNIPDNAAVGAWNAGVQLTDIDIPTNANFQYDSQTLTLAAAGLTAGNLTQFELTRINPTGGTELVGDWNLLHMRITFS